MNYVYQFDMSSANIPSTQTIVAIYDGYYSPHYPFATTFYLSQLAPDGKIYINCGNSTLDIHVINYPDSLGMNCDVCQHCIHLPTYNGFTIPNHPNYFLGAEKGSVCDTIEVVENIVKPEPTLNIYPNPVATEEITFTYNVSSEQGVLSIYNIEGREVASYTLPQWSSVQQLTLPKLTSGVYLARLTQGNATAGVKFLRIM